MFKQELLQILKEFKVWVISLFILAILFFGFGLKPINYHNLTYFIPFPSENSISTQLIVKIKNELLGPGIKFIVTDPLSAFSAQIEISLFFSFILTLPLFLFALLKALLPAFYAKEQRAILLIIFPSLVLFILGCLFGYYLITPITLHFLYGFAQNLEAENFIGISDFINFVVSIMMFTGLLFLQPVFMVLLKTVGLIKPKFWIDKWRYAVAFFAIFTAIITPDGSGLTMVLLFLPLALLYYLGYLIASRI